MLQYIISIRVKLESRLLNLSKPAYDSLASYVEHCPYHGTLSG